MNLSVPVKIKLSIDYYKVSSLKNKDGPGN